MFYAYDSAFGGRGVSDAVKQPKPPKPPKERTPDKPESISSNSSERTSSSSSSSSSSSQGGGYARSVSSAMTGRSSSEKSAFGFSFGFSRKASKSQLHLKLPSLHRPHSRNSEDPARPPASRDGRASPLPITPSGPATAQVAHDFALSKSFTRPTDYMHGSAGPPPPSPGLSVTQSFDNRSLRGSRTPKTVSLNSIDSTYRSLSPRETLMESRLDDYAENSILDMFPLTPDSTTPSFPSIDRTSSACNSPFRRRTSGSDSVGSASVSSSTYSDDRFRPGGLPTIIDSELPDMPHPPLPPVPGMGPGKSPFEQAIARMEGSGLKMMLRRLSEDWGTARNDHNIEEVLFEQQLWSLMARQWLTQGKQLQSPAHEALLDDPHPEEEKRILNLHGSIADGWVLAAKYPDIMVYTLSADQDEPLVQNHNWAAPRNHHISCIPATDDFFPFPDNHFDVITSRRFASVVKSKSWLSVFQECHRCLKPRGWLEVQSLDAVPSRHGELLTAWLEARLIPGIEDSGLVAKSAKRVLDYMEIAGFGEIKTCKIALPVIAKASLSHEHQDKQDAVKLMVHTGRHYYQELYREFLRGGCSGSGGKSPWWWGNKTIREECERMGTLFGFLVSFGQKEF